MLADIHPETETRRAAMSGEPASCTIHIDVPDFARAGVLDVLSMRSLVRACRYALARRQQDEFDRALAKMININGAMAQAIERGRVRRG